MVRRPDIVVNIRCILILHINENKYLCGSQELLSISFMLRVSFLIFSIVKTDSDMEESMTEV